MVGGTAGINGQEPDIAIWLFFVVFFGGGGGGGGGGGSGPWDLRA